MGCEPSLRNAVLDVSGASLRTQNRRHNAERQIARLEKTRLSEPEFLLAYGLIACYRAPQDVDARPEASARAQETAAAQRSSSQAPLAHAGPVK